MYNIRNIYDTYTVYKQYKKYPNQKDHVAELEDALDVAAYDVASKWADDTGDDVNKIINHIKSVCYRVYHGLAKQKLLNCYPSTFLNDFPSNLFEHWE